TLGELGDQLLDAGLCHREGALLLALLERDLLAEGLLKQPSEGGLRLAPLGLPLWPGLNWYSLGGRPGPTLYPAADAGVAETGFCPLFPFDDGLEATMKSFHN